MSLVLVEKIVVVVVGGGGDGKVVVVHSLSRLLLSGLGRRRRHCSRARELS
jgi:hypothetical protein